MEASRLLWGKGRRSGRRGWTAEEMELREMEVVQESLLDNTNHRNSNFAMRSCSTQAGM